MSGRPDIDDRTQEFNFCLCCGKQIDSATLVAQVEADGKEMGEKRTPTAGSFSVCFYCGHIAVFTDELFLRELPADKFEALPSAQKVYLVRLQELVRREHYTSAIKTLTAVWP
jgi:hypothetical protein